MQNVLKSPLKAIWVFLKDKSNSSFLLIVEKPVKPLQNADHSVARSSSP